MWGLFLSSERLAITPGDSVIYYFPLEMSASVRGCCCLVVFKLKPSLYPTTSSVHQVSVLILHPRELQIMRSQTKTEKKQNNRELIKVGQSNANVPGTYGSTNQHANQEDENLKKKM